MGKQIIISVGREFGSGGHEIAERLAKHYNIPLYDKEIFDHVQEKGSINADVAKYFDEKPVNPIFYPVSMDGSYLPLEQTVANHIFDFIRTKGDKEKESFVIVGRCAEYVLRDNPNVVSIFILGNRDVKQRRVMKKYQLEEKAALPQLYREIGESYNRLDKWSMYLITSYDRAENDIGRKADKNRKIYNGMLKTYYYQFLGPKPPRRKKD